MTAIGHELDVTIADLVADVRASVPMDAGQRLADQWSKATERVDSIEGNIISSFKKACRELEIKLANYNDNFLSCYAKHMSQCKKQIYNYQNNLTRCFRDVLIKIKRIEENFNYNYERFLVRLTNNKQTIETMEGSLFREANQSFTKLNEHMTVIEEQFAHNYTLLQRYLNSLHVDLVNYEKQVKREAKRWYLIIVKKIADCERMLLACDPQLKLKQGFSIVKDNKGKVIKSSKTVKVSDIIAVQLFEGVLDSKVEEIH
jgi:exodeoxyribonuclease VII large subunit